MPNIPDIIPDINGVQLEIADTAHQLFSKVNQMSDAVTDSVKSFSVLEQIKERPAIALTLAVVSGVVVGRTLTKNFSSQNFARAGEVITPLATAVLINFLNSQKQ
jgi:hypothetical protein